MYARSIPVWLLLTAAGLAGQSANAATYCISTVSGLNASMDAANTADEGTTHELRLRPGTYAVPAGLEFNPAGDKDSKYFAISGGWNSDCSARTINPAATVLDANNGAADGGFRFTGNNTHYIIEGLRFTNFDEVYLDDANCGFDCPDTQLIRVRYNEFRNGPSVNFRGKDAATMTVTNNLFADLDTNSGTLVGIAYVNNENPPTIAFNTVAGLQCASSAGDALYVFSQAAGVVLHHNIVQSVGCGGDITVPTGSGSQPVTLRNNLYHSLSGLAPALQSGNVITLDPGFVNAAGGNYRLRESGSLSSAINAGLTPTNAQVLGLSASVPSQDLDGPAGARLIGNQYDIGAYESSINNASVLTVTTENDSGTGSLRAQIAAANAAPGAQKIEFNIPGGCTPTPHLILLQSPLPDITDDLEIDGYSEPEAAANTLDTGSDAVLCIIVASQADTLAQALQVPAAAPTDTNLTVKGLAFAGSTGFNGNFTVAIRLRGGRDHLIQGNAFAGTGPGAIGNLGTMNFGLQIRDSAQNVLVGGSAPEHRNSFGAMSSSAIVLNDATSAGHRIQNNYIGLSASGISASPIGLNGIFASNSPDIEVLDNVFAAIATSAALSITGATATGYRIAGNRFGSSATGVPVAAFRNLVGIQVSNGSGGHVIGSVVGLAASNVIANSSDAGVWITTTAGDGIVVRPNQVFGNGVDGVGLGVDIGTLGPSVNDLLDQDSGPNNGQNHPTIVASAPNADGSRQVSFELNSNPNTTFRVDVYRASACPGGNRGGEMFTRIGTVTGTSNAQGNFDASFAMSGGSAPGYLVAQATNLSSNDSSEPGPCFLEPIATTTTITNDSPDPSAFGQPYTVTVLVNAASGNATGTVTVSDGTGVQCSDNSIIGGIASCQMLSASLGNKTLTATYSGSATHAPSSDTDAHSVIQASTTTTITGDAPDPSQVGQAYTVNVQVRTPAGNLAVPSGQVTISDGDAQVCSPIVLDAQGNGSCQAVSLIPGNKTLTANYAGNANLAGSNDTEPHIVTSASTTTTITSDAPDPSAVNQAYTVQVTVSSQPGAGPVTGSVAVTDGSGANCNIAALANGSGSCQLTSTSAGNKTLTASYTPNTAAFTASSDTEAHTVGPVASTTTITSDAPDPSLVGQAYTVMVTVGSGQGTPSGTVNVADGSGATCQVTLNAGSGSCQLTSTSAGNKTLTADYLGNASHAPSSDTEPHVVNTPQAAATTTTITAVAPTPSRVGEPYLVSVTVTSQGGTPTGSVNINNGVGAGSSTCQATLVNGSGSCQLTSTLAGSPLLTACMVANASFAGSCDNENHSVAKADTQLSFGAISPDPALEGTPSLYTVTIAAVAPGAGTPTGTITLSGPGGASCQIVLPATQCALTLAAAGAQSVTANYAGDANFNASARNTTVNVAAQQLFRNGFE